MTDIVQPTPEVLNKHMKKLNVLKDRSLTMKQRRWLEAYIATGNATEAAMQAYDVKDRDSARALGSENLAKLSIAELLEEMGLSDVMLTSAIKEGVQATRSTNAAILLTTDGKTVKAEEQGLIETPDYATRHKYIETALKLKKKLGTNENQFNVQVNNLISSEGGKYGF